MNARGDEVAPDAKAFWPRVGRSTPGQVQENPINVMIASLRRRLLETLLPRLASEPGIEAFGDPVDDAERLLRRLSERPPDMLLLDQPLLDRLGTRLIETLRRQAPGVRVLLLCDEVSHGLVESILRHRFRGFLLTSGSPDACVKAIRAISRGELWLPRALLADALSEPLHVHDPGDATSDDDSSTIDPKRALSPREAQVVGYLHQGFTNKEIARRLGIMEDTVKKHLQSVFAKLGVHRRSLVVLRQAPVQANRV